MIERIVLDKTSAVPLHYQLSHAIASLIEDGALEPNQPLPNEHDLCSLLDISRSTVRQAFKELIEARLVYRPRSRSVLHVAPKRIHQKLGRLRGFFTEDMLTAGLTPTSKVMALEVNRFPDVAQRLGLPEETEWYRIQRVHEGNGEPVSIQVSWIPRIVVGSLTVEEASRSLLQIIEARYVSPVSRAVQTIGVRFPNKAERTLLHMTPNMGVYHVERATYAEDGQVCEYFTCVLPTDRFDFTMDLSVTDRWSTTGERLGISLEPLIGAQR